MKIQGRIFNFGLIALFSMLAVGCNVPTGINPVGTINVPSDGGNNGTGGSSASGSVSATPTPAASVAPISSATPTPTPVSVSGGVTKPSLVGALGIHESIDLRSFDGPVMSQFGGTCSTFATAAAMNNVLKSKGIDKLVSERDLWSLYGIYDADAAVQAASNNNVLEEQYWPVNGSKAANYAESAKLRITQTVAHEYNMESALQGLSAGHPMVMAIQVPSSLDNCDAMISPTSAATTGQHVVEAVGYQLDDSVSGGGYFIAKNSWGSTCGDKGYFYYPFSLCKRTDLYCYFIEIDDVSAL